MSSASNIAARLAVKAASFFTRHGSTWVSRVVYANGKAYDWAVVLVGERFIVETRSGSSVLQAKKRFATLTQAQKFAARFIDRADGEHLLRAATDADKFKPVKS